MPVYEWYCLNCNSEKETLQGINDPPPLCPKCCYNPDKQGKHEVMKKKYQSLHLLLKVVDGLKMGIQNKLQN